MGLVDICFADLYSTLLIEERFLSIYILIPT